MKKGEKSSSSSGMGKGKAATEEGRKLPTYQDQDGLRSKNL